MYPGHSRVIDLHHFLPHPRHFAPRPQPHWSSLLGSSGSASRPPRLDLSHRPEDSPDNFGQEPVTWFPGAISHLTHQLAGRMVCTCLSVSTCLCVPVCPCVGGRLAILITNPTQPLVAMRAMTLRVSCAQEEHTAWLLPRVPRLGEGAAKERADLTCHRISKLIKRKAP